MSQTTTETDTLLNGDAAHSAFVDHLASYPLISSGIATYKSYPLGAQSIAIANQGYARFVTPFLTHPFAQETLKPRIKPILNRADSFGDESLSTIDARFPIVTQNPQEIQNQILGLLQRPLGAAGEGKKYIFGIYNQQYEKHGKGYFAGVKALITTSLITTADTLSAAAGWVAKKEDEAKAKADSQLNGN